MLNSPSVMSGPTPGPGEQVVTVHTLGHQPTSDRLKYRGGLSRSIGWLVLIGGIGAFILGCLLIWACSVAGVAGAGLWGGIAYIVAGSLGVCAGKNKTKGYIVGFVSLTIVAVLLGCGVIIVVAVALAADDSLGTYYCSSYTSFETRGTVMECLLLIIAILEMLFLIWGLYISCGIACFGKVIMENQTNHNEVQYTESKSMIISSATPAEKSAHLAEKSEYFKFPPQKDLHYSTDSQYVSQYTHDDSTQQHQEDHSLQYSHHDGSSHMHQQAAPYYRQGSQQQQQQQQQAVEYNNQYYPPSESQTDYYQQQPQQMQQQQMQQQQMQQQQMQQQQMQQQQMHYPPHMQNMPQHHVSSKQSQHQNLSYPQSPHYYKVSNNQPSHQATEELQPPQREPQPLQFPPRYQRGSSSAQESQIEQPQQEQQQEAVPRRSHRRRKSRENSQQNYY